MPNEQNGESRLDRIERGIEHLLQFSSKQEEAIAEHTRQHARHDQEISELRDIAKRSLTMLEGVIQVTARRQTELDRLGEYVKAAAESGRHTGGRLNALIGFVAGWRIPPPSPAS